MKLPALTGLLVSSLLAMGWGALSVAQEVPPKRELEAPAARTVAPSAHKDLAPLSCPFCDLRGADLSGRDLTDVNLQGADLTGANLSGAVLDGAVLVGTNLTEANLNDVTAGRTGRGPANLSRANLTGASLVGARLQDADLQYATLPGADFTRVDALGVVFGPELRAGIYKGARTTFHRAKLAHEFRINESAIDLRGVRWKQEEVPPLDKKEKIACGEADLSGLSERIYVTADGTDGEGCGATPETPCKTIAEGIRRCSGPGCGVLVWWDEYREGTTLALVNGINIYGGCLPSKQARKEYFSVLFAPDGGAPAISATDLSPVTILQGFQINASAATGSNGEPAIALLVSGGALTSLDNQIVGNRGARGAPGETGAAGAAGGNGSGRTAGTVSACSGTSGGTGSVQMKVSVDVGFIDFTCKPSCSENACYGYQGQPGSTGKWATGGKWRDGNCAECPSSRGQTGERGAAGTAAGCGSPGVAASDTVGRFSAGRWTGSQGGTGGAGGRGGGGAGAGAGGYRAGACFWVKTEDPGNSGGGGGAGGCAGSGGTGGHQGGASFAVVAHGASLDLTGSTIIGGAGGQGGEGGAGGQGGKGGSGASGATNTAGGYGGAGGNGGPGGNGAGGAGGNGGPSIGVALVSGAQISADAASYYLGQSGVTGAPGPGGKPISTGACQAPDGESGSHGLIVKRHTF